MNNINIMLNILDEPLEIAGLTSIVIESKSVFARIVKDIYDYENGNQADIRLFDKKQNSLSPSDILIITDIVTFDTNSASSLKIIYKDLEDAISLEPNKKIKIEYLLGEVWLAISKEAIHFELNLSIEKISLQSIFKAANIKIENNCESIFTKTMTILEFFKYLPKKKLLIFVNLGSYLSEEEMKTIEEYVMLKNTNVLLIDNHVFPISKQTIVDEDFFIMHKAQKK